MKSKPERRRVAVFDVCDTLFSTNTTVGFLRFFAPEQQDQALNAAIRRWTSRSSPWFLAGAAAYKLLGVDLARTGLLRALRGHARSELEAAAAEYARGDLASQMVKPVHDRLREHVAHGDRVILASNSLDIVIRAIAADLGVEWLASELEFQGGRSTGRLAVDLTGAKGRELAKRLQGEAAAVHVYTDNRSDKDLLAFADRRTIIIPRGRGGGRWAGEDCEYLAL